MSRFDIKMEPVGDIYASGYTRARAHGGARVRKGRALKADRRPTLSPYSTRPQEKTVRSRGVIANAVYLYQTLLPRR